ncbi:MAG: peptidylprolyl isomerase [Myxococcota bacterium]|jgi:peptidyl-prolyl cis-trans isomerase A (cyclophilin A)|nr:peptidylprolyl isomerase [Myxococcota bacterium]MDP7074415.1 peptidylprolyl isomerase [Myxococcota bacterium]MDP7300569.1 peptidylprolyl isomerase [Myxococcota bacterium]MDP7434168.1 peptidylprolyl isomerase [Myxococcota bacterium]HJO25403.1 peptidylprolyl isomerase [Myxococcota bacterium]
MHLRQILPSGLLLVSLAACGGDGSSPAEVEAPSKAAAPPPEAPAPVAPPVKSIAEKRAAYHAGMLDPAQATEQAPETFTVKFETTKGDMLIDVTRAWAPTGADRFYNLVNIGFFDDVALFRVIKGFMAQFGINGDPEVSAAWKAAVIEDDPVKESNEAGYVTFARSGPNSRTTQIFVNFVDNSRLDKNGFAPFGKLRDMKALESIYWGYGESAPRGKGPNQSLLQSKGNAYLAEEFPKLDYVKKATIVSE